MKWIEVDKDVEERVLNNRRGAEITEMLYDFLGSSLPVAQIDEEDVKRYKNVACCRQTINSAIRKFNKKNNAFLSVVTNKNKVYLINRSVAVYGD